MSQIAGFTADAWENAKAGAVLAMVQAGRQERLLSYTDLSNSIVSIRIEPHDFAMDRLLDEISKEEDAAGRGF